MALLGATCGSSLVSVQFDSQIRLDMVRIFGSFGISDPLKFENIINMVLYHNYKTKEKTNRIEIPWIS